MLSADAADWDLACSSSTLSEGTGGLRAVEAVAGEGLLGVDFVRRRGDGLGAVGDKRALTPNLDVGGVNGARGDVVLTDEVVRRRDCPEGEVGESGAFAGGERGVLGEGERHLDEGGTRRVLMLLTLSLIEDANVKSVEVDATSLRYQRKRRSQKCSGINLGVASSHFRRRPNFRSCRWHRVWPTSVTDS